MSLKSTARGLPARFLFCLVCVLPCPLLWAQEVEVLGLFKNAALLRVQGEEKLVKKGESLAGVLLLEADSRQAVVRVDGVRRVLALSARIDSSYSDAGARAVTIYRNARLQYVTSAAVNGKRLQVLVDTGANTIAMNESTATRLGLNYTSGALLDVMTASGPARAWRVQLESVDVGGIRINYLDASVLEGDQPELMLLGTNYLKHVEMQENDGVLMLVRKF